MLCAVLFSSCASAARFRSTGQYLGVRGAFPARRWQGLFQCKEQYAYDKDLGEFAQAAGQFAAV
eukprot:3342820-Lingulodinium_polyedra.AAC.1